MSADRALGRILTIAEAAARLKLNHETVRRLCRDGRVPAAKFGKSWRLRESDIDALFITHRPGDRWAKKPALEPPSADEVAAFELYAQDWLDRGGGAETP